MTGSGKNNLTASSSYRFLSYCLKVGPISCPETSVYNCQSALHAAEVKIWRQNKFIMDVSEIGFRDEEKKILILENRLQMTN